MSRRSIARFWILAGILLALPVVTYFAVHGDGLFELGDGTGAPGTADILADATVPLQAGPDWADLFGADGTPKDSDNDGNPDFHQIFGGVAASFIADDLSQAGQVDATVFAQSNKNNDPIGTWNWDTGNNPPKDDLVNVYSYAALNAFDELVIYAGLERLAEEGDSHVDFEFNQSRIGLDKEVPCGSDGSGGAADGSPCEFTGAKMVNDLLVVMDFERGGRLGFVEVRRWNGTDYVLIEALGGEGCTADDAICAFNNSTAIDGGPWVNYDRQGNVITELQPNAFTEIGINVTALLGLTPCFGTVQSKTRSSQSFTSELKDFAFGGFDVCAIAVDKTGPALSKVGDDATFTYTISNEGAVALALASAIDDPIGDLTSQAAAAGCDPLDPGESCTFSVDFTIPAGSPDPFVNIVTVEYDPDGGGSAPNLTAEDDHSVNLFQPGVEVTKTGDGRSKAGDAVRYRIDVVNTGSADSPDLVNGTIVDTLLGDLLDPANPYVTAGTCTATLATGASCAIEAGRIVLATDPDPLPNTVTVHYNPDGFPNDISDSDDHSVDLFQVGVRVEKTGDTLSKAGDPASYRITVANTGSADSPSLVGGTIVDTLLGDLLDPANPYVVSGTCAATLAPGASCEILAMRTVEASDPDPLPNTVTVTYAVEGFPNTVSHSASHAVNLFQPCVDVEKGGDTLSKAGDAVNYTITVTNCSSADSPDLVNGSIVDTLLGDLLAANALVTSSTCTTTLPAGGSCAIGATRTVLATDPDPLPNTVTVHYNPDGFPNDISDSDSHSVDLVHPDYTLDKLCAPLSATVGSVVTYSIAIANTGDVALNRISVTDTLLGDVSASFPATLAAGASATVTLTRTILSTDPDTLVNSVTAVYQVAGLPNLLARQSSCSVEIQRGCALSPGFWGGGSGRLLWDQSTDLLGGQPVPFTTTTEFPWLAPHLDGTTYLGVLNLSTKGDVTVQLAFKYIAARLNEAASFGVPGDVAILLDAVDAYFMSNPVGSRPTGTAKDQGTALFNALNAYFATVGEDDCPPISEF